MHGLPGLSVAILRIPSVSYDKITQWLHITLGRLSFITADTDHTTDHTADNLRRHLYQALVHCGVLEARNNTPMAQNVSAHMDVGKEPMADTDEDIDMPAQNTLDIEDADVSDISDSESDSEVLSNTEVDKFPKDMTVYLPTDNAANI